MIKKATLSLLSWIPFIWDTEFEMKNPVKEGELIDLGEPKDFNGDYPFSSPTTHRIEMEGPIKEEKIVDLGEPQKFKGCNPFLHPTTHPHQEHSASSSGYQNGFHCPLLPSGIPKSPDMFPNMMAQFQQLENRLDAYEMTTREFEIHHREIQVEIRDF